MKQKAQLAQVDEDHGKATEKTERALKRAEEKLADYEVLVDRTQHMLNMRIQELEQARTALRERAEELQAGETRFKQLAEAAFEAILITGDSVVQDCNEAACVLYGIPRKELIGLSLLDLVQESLRHELRARLEIPDGIPFEQVHKGQNGNSIPVEIRIKRIEREQPGSRVVAIRDITEHKILEDRLRHLASTDALTGSNNRRHFMELANKEYFRCVRYGQTLSIAMMDIDFFKHINDKYGHDAGDQALCHFVNLTTEILRNSDVLGRLGGEEFALLLPLTAIDGARVLAERARYVIEQSCVNFGTDNIKFTVSIGVTQIYPGQDSGIETILSRADKNLYEAKNSGRNRVICK